MYLLPDERRRLDSIAGFLRAEEPRLAAMFDMFTRLAREDGRPPPERQFLADGPWRELAFARERVRRRRHRVYALVLAVLIGILILGLS